MKTVIHFIWRIRVAIAWVVMVAGIVGMITAGFRFSDYSYWMLKGDYERANERVYLGDKAYSHFNNGELLYEKNDYDSARKEMEKALAECVGTDGQLKESHRLIAAQCQFYIGNCRFNDKKTAEAVSAYEECLKLHPPHYWAKYNLEKLQETKPQSGGGKGGGKPAKKI